MRDLNSADDLAEMERVVAVLTARVDVCGA